MFVGLIHSELYSECCNIDMLSLECIYDPFQC